MPQNLRKASKTAEPTAESVTEPANVAEEQNETPSWGKEKPAFEEFVKRIGLMEVGKKD
ncbi:hypothetical protein ACJ73_09882 [Blastomyces percursus]|uniref:Uncharacterized protein n=1 Tax=Blastomyces percursus TaxID=1658174 RepID=A0A1J9P087_9EURO|nr:hypothetical protein ACJ73_09882 [Blastomyces percursus]